MCFLIGSINAKDQLQIAETWNSFNKIAWIAFDFVITDTDTKQRKVFFDASSDDVHVFPNLTDTAGSTIADLINEAYTINQEMTLGYSVQSTGNPNVAGYFDGVADGTDDNDDFTSPSWGTNFQIGADNGTANNFYGIIQSIAFFNKFLSATDQATVDAILNP